MARYLLALDIDGTITESDHTVHPDMVKYLEDLTDQGAAIGFITGRFFPFAKAPLEGFTFPFYLATQNGAELYEFPSQKKLLSYYISKDLILEIDTRLKGSGQDFIVYTDASCGYKTFYRESTFSHPLIDHILNLNSATFHPYQKLECFSELPVRAAPCIKFFGKKDELEEVKKRLEDLPISQTLIQDPTCDLYHMNLVTHLEATKGHASKSLLKLMNESLPVIAAGNDLNDLTLLKEATLGICVGETAPSELYDAAKLISKSSGLGLVPVIETAKQILGL